MIRKKRILFAPVDMGYRMELYTKFIQKCYAHQLEPESLVIFVLSRQHYKTNYNYEFHFPEKASSYRWFRSLLNFLFSLFRYDIFHFFSGETLLTRKLRRFELIIYKLFGKRVIMHFVGSDIRSEEYIYWKEKNIKQFLQGNNDFPKSEPWQIKLIKDVEKYTDYIMVSTPDLKELIPKAVYYPVMLDLDKYLQELNEIPSAQKKQNEIVILHCPSGVKKSRLKGTDHINLVLNKLIANPKYNIRLILPAKQEKERSTNYSATRYELFQYYKEADIIIDQLVIGWYGLLSVEALASGKQVISYVDEHLKSYLFPDCPIEIADVNTLENVIIKCIENVLNKNPLTVMNNIKWVKKYHTIENNHSALLNAWGLTKA